MELNEPPQKNFLAPAPEFKGLALTASEAPDFDNRESRMLNTTRREIKQEQKRIQKAVFGPKQTMTQQAVEFVRAKRRYIKKGFAGLIVIAILGSGLHALHLYRNRQAMQALQVQSNTLSDRAVLLNQSYSLTEISEFDYIRQMGRIYYDMDNLIPPDTADTYPQEQLHSRIEKANHDKNIGTLDKNAFTVQMKILAEEQRLIKRGGPENASPLNLNQGLQK